MKQLLFMALLSFKTKQKTFNHQTLKILKFKVEKKKFFESKFVFNCNVIGLDVTEPFYLAISF